MDSEDDFSQNEYDETGSDELLSDDHLRLPDEASPLVRLHAVRSWLKRRKRETDIEIGLAALKLQDLQEAAQTTGYQRRREREESSQAIQQAEQAFHDMRERLTTYEDAETELEDCVNHTTIGARLLVEYYLTLDNLIQNEFAEHDGEQTIRATTLLDVQRRIEHVGTPHEDE